MNSNDEFVRADVLSDENLMGLAIAEARNALERGEVPIGCIIVNDDGAVLTCGSNRTTERCNATAHAEIVAFEELRECSPEQSLTLYVTCEPCIMCAAAIVSVAAIKRVVFGCQNPRFGGCGSVRGLDLYDGRRALPELQSGIRAGEAVELLTEFYRRTNPNAPVPKRKKR